MTNAVTLSRYDRTSVQAIYDDMVQLYLAANPDILHLSFFSREQFERAFVNQRAHDDFELVAAHQDGKLVGVIFGFTEIPGEQYAICELMVAPDARRQGVAKQLHDELLRLRPEHRGDLYVRQDNEPALAAYRKWGWVKVGEVQPRADAPVLDEMQVGLPLAGEG